MASGTIKSSDIFTKKVLFEINNGHKVGQFIADYISEKSYGSFRTFSKRLNEVTNKLLEDGHISASEMSIIKKAIEEKLSTKQPEIVFDFKKYIDEYIELFEIYKEQLKHPLNTLFLTLPFLTSMTFGEIQDIKCEEIEIVDLSNSLLIKFKKNDGSNFKNIKVTQNYKEWSEIFTLIKSSKENQGILFDNEIMISYTVFSQKLETYLSKYSKKKTSGTKYYTLLKNCLKYDSNFCSII